MTELSVPTLQRALPHDSGSRRRVADSKLFNAFLASGVQGSLPDTRLSVMPGG